MPRDVESVVAALDGAAIPVAQLQWAPSQAPPLPYAVLVPLGTRNRFGDGRTVAAPVPYSLEVYSRERDMALERRVQGLLDGLGVGWQRDHATDPDGPCVIAYYSVTLTE